MRFYGNHAPTGHAVRQFYPWPTAWRENVNRIGKDFLAATCISVTLIALGTLLIRDGTVGLSFLFLGVSVASLSGTLFVYSRSDFRTSIDRVRSREGRIFLPANRLCKTFLQIGNFAALLTGLFALFIPLSDTFAGDRRDRQFYIVVAVLAPMAILWATGRLLGRFIFRHGSQMGVAVSQYGVHHTSWWGESDYEWSHIEGITVTSGMTRSAVTRRPKKGNSLLVGLILTPEAKASLKGWAPSTPISRWGPVMRNLTTINAAALDVYPPVVARVLTFYFEHPELREELGTEKAMERIRTGNFVA